MSDILTISNLVKRYDGGFEALSGVDLSLKEGEVLALLGPNGAGKTTLISTICGISTPTSGTITVGGHDAIRDYRAARSLIGLVPQEVNLEPFSKVWDTVRYTRGLFGKPANDALIEDILKKLSLWDKKDRQVRELSGGMKRRVLIAKALSHEPRILFLDEPTAGVDVELRKGMWDTMEELRRDGVTIILTTHYIEEAEAIADRVAVIRKGKILLIEEKQALMNQMGQKQLRIELTRPVAELPASLAEFDLQIVSDGQAIVYSYDTRGTSTGITSLLSALREAGLQLADLSTSQSSLEDIFVGLVHEEEDAA